MYACINTYIHTYLHAYIHTYIHAYMHTYKHAYMHTYMQTCIHAYKHASMHACYIQIISVYYRSLASFLLVTDVRAEILRRDMLNAARAKVSPAPHLIHPNLDETNLIRPNLN